MFEHVKAFSGFSVDDIPAARRFYGEVLGLRVSEEHGMLTLHIAGGPGHAGVPEGGPHARGVHDPQLPGARRRRRRWPSWAPAASSFEKYDWTDEKGIARDYGPTIAWFRDPAGNVLSVIQLD